MRRGSPGFEGTRLREARRARGLSGTALAEMLGLSRQAVSQYERGTASPSSDVLERIAVLLELPAGFFFLPRRREQLSPVFFRSLSSATEDARDRSARRIDWLQDIVSYLSEFVDLPEINFPMPFTSDDLAALTRDNIEALATDARRFWRLGDGPISNVVWLLENNGAIVSRGVLEQRTLDALSSRADDDIRPFIFLGSDKQSAARSRFDVAHELGHQILHRKLTKWDVAQPEIHRLIETQADQFASSFLLPVETFIRDLQAPTLDAMCTMKARWHVSIAAILMRAIDLGFVSEEHGRALFVARSRRKWVKQEPLDGVLEAEEPRVLARAIKLLVDEEILSKTRIVSDLNLPPMDIEVLAGLPAGYLSDAPPIKLRDHARIRAGERRMRTMHGGGGLIDLEATRDSSTRPS